MEAQGAALARSGLRTLIAEASQSLAHLDASRLEELALACQALSGALPDQTAEEREEVFREMRAAAGEMEILARVLEATRGNLRVMQRLRDLRAGRIEYTEGQARGWAAAEGAEGGDGHD